MNLQEEKTSILNGAIFGMKRKEIDAKLDAYLVLLIFFRPFDFLYFPIYVVTILLHLNLNT